MYVLLPPFQIRRFASSRLVFRPRGRRSTLLPFSNRKMNFINETKEIRVLPCTATYVCMMLRKLLFFLREIFLITGRESGDRPKVHQLRIQTVTSSQDTMVMQQQERWVDSCGKSSPYHWERELHQRSILTGIHSQERWSLFLIGRNKMTMTKSSRQL